jgi:hypothetical protein
MCSRATTRGAVWAITIEVTNAGSAGLWKTNAL